MTQYDNQNAGILSRNDRKETEKHPDFKGFCDIEGTEYWISGWIREAGPQAKTPGRKFFSLRFEPKVAGHARPHSAAAGTRDGVVQDGGPQGPSRGSQAAYAEDDLPF